MHPRPVPRFLSRPARAWWALLACALALALALAAWLWRERVQLQARESAHLQLQVRVVRDNLGAQLRAIGHALTVVGADLGRWRKAGESAPQINARLHSITEALVGVRTLNVIDAGGRIVASSRDELLGRAIADRDYFLRARAAASPATLVVGAPVQVRPDRWATHLVRAMADAQGGFAGAISATLDDGQLQALIESVRYASDVSVELVHDNG